MPFLNSGCWAEASREPIAIIGFALKFPQDANNTEGFWKMLIESRCASTDIPQDRMNSNAFHEKEDGGGESHNTFVNRGGHFLQEDIARFDAPFFSISPAEAASMDPQQRALLETTYHALENAGIPLNTVSGSKTSVITGCFTDDYKYLYAKDPEQPFPYGATGLSMALLANRLSWFFNFTGISANVDTACSSSLLALDLACQNLIAHDSNMAIVAGCNLLFSADMMLLLSNLNLLSKTSKAFSFDHRANGYARGEGNSVIVIKRLSDALKDGNTVRAIIRSTHSNQNGFSAAGITRTSQYAQEVLIRETYEKAHLETSTTKYVEAHGTGTRLGDAFEANALGEVFRKSRIDGEVLYVGAVKSNIGHLEGGSGLAGLIKTILILERGIIPPNTNYEIPNPRIDEEFLKIKFPLKPTPWPTSGLRRASVNGMGFGGSNSHVVIDDAYHFFQQHNIQGKHNTTLKPANVIDSSPVLEHEVLNTSGEYGVETLHITLKDVSKLLVFSGSDSASLRRLAALYSQHFTNLISYSMKTDSEASEYMSNLAFTLSARRTLLPWKSFLVVNSIKELELLESKLSDPVHSQTSPRLGFVFTGQGAQWPGMSKELLKYPVFYDSLKHSELYLQSIGCPWLLLDELHKKLPDSKIDLPDFSQPLCTAIQLAMVDLLFSFGIFPNTIVGFSSGEIAAAYCIGAISAMSAMRIAYHRGVQASLLSTPSHAPGAMMAVALSETEIQPYLTQVFRIHGSRGLIIACFNSPSSLTISGDAAQIESLKSLLSGANKKWYALKVNVAYHSYHMHLIAESYAALIEDLEKGEPHKCLSHVTMISTVTNKDITVDELCSSQYWVQNLISPVRFDTALSVLCTPINGTITKKFDRTHHKIKTIDSLIEIGPHAALRGPIQDIIRACNGKITYMSMLKRNTSASKSVLEVVGQLHCMAYPIKMYQVNSPSTPMHQLTTLCDLPEYPFDHSKSYWKESRLSKGVRFCTHPLHTLLGKPTADWNPLDARWRNHLEIKVLPWIEHHKIQNTALYPAAGILVMVLEAAKQVANPSLLISGIFIAETKFEVALPIGATNKVETQLSLRPLPKHDAFDRDEDWFEFVLYSYDNSKWSKNASGRVGIEYEGNTALAVAGRTKRENLNSFQSLGEGDLNTSLSPFLDIEKLYRGLKNSGYEYGPSFQVLENVQISPNRGSGQVRIFQQFPINDENFESHIIHPTTLDGILHLILALLTKGGSESIPTIVPTQVEYMWIASTGLGYAYGVPSPDRINATAQYFSDGFLGSTTNISVLDQTGEYPLANIKGLKFQKIAGANLNPLVATSTRFPILCRRVNWKPDISLLDNEELQELCEIGGEKRAEPIEFFKNLDCVIYMFIVCTLRKFEADDLSQLPFHAQRYVEWMKRQNELYKLEELPNELLNWEVLTDNIAYFESLCTKVENFNTKGKLFVTVGKNLFGILNGDINPLSLFSQEDMLSSAYDQIKRAPTCMQSLKTYVDHLAHENPTMGVLEIGAGISVTTSSVMDILASQNTSEFQSPAYDFYDFANISSPFLNKVKNTFQDIKRIRYKILDIGLEPSTQGFILGSYDLIIVSNVIRVTENLTIALQHIHSLLKPGGKLILLETVQPHIARSGFVAGLMPEWWLGKEKFRQYNPCLSIQQWNEVLLCNGFSGCDLSFRDYESEACHEMAIMISSATEIPTKPAQKFRIIIITANSDETSCHSAFEFERQFQFAGIIIDSIITIREVSRTNIGKDSICVVVAELQRPFFRNISRHDFSNLQTLISQAKGIVWITRGGGLCANPDFGIVDGFSRVVRNENNRTVFLTVAFDTQGDISSRQIQNLGKIIRRTDFGSLVNIYESAFVEKNGTLEIGRVVYDEKFTHMIVKQSSPFQSKIQNLNECFALQMKIKQHGLLNTFHFIEDVAVSQPLECDEVEIHVEAFGLTFKDCMTALGKLEGDSFGFECSGVVSRVGKNCDIVPGTRILALAGDSSKTFVRASRYCVFPVPDGMSFAESAGIAASFYTAYYTLELARAKKGDSILIHSASGGTGQAVIQVARYLGITEIFATVGSSEKKSFLVDQYSIPEDHIFSSRNVLFAEQIKQMTKNGVDVIMNSLSGKGLVASWSCIAPYGRFIELGKEDIISNSLLPMRPFLKNVSYFGFDLSDIMRQHPDHLLNTTNALAKLFSSGKLQPISPLHTYPISEVEDAFRLMQTGKSFGKIVVERVPNSYIKVTMKSSTATVFCSAGTYVIAGGLGGIGRTIARWMVEKGARYLLLLSRSGGENAGELVKELETKGATIMAPACNIADIASLQKALTKAAVLPPIKGCVQAAMFLRDCLFQDMSFNDWSEGTEAKINGSWNLHQLLPADLDFFVMLSSVTGIIGQIGQTGYCSGNTYQDALASYRVSQGKRAISIDLGPMLSDGYLSQNENVLKQIMASGYLYPISQENLFALLDRYCNSSPDSVIPESQIITGLQRPDLSTEDLKTNSRLASKFFSYLHIKDDIAMPYGETSKELNTTRTKFLLAETNTDAGAVATEGLVKKISKSLPAIKDVDLWQPMMTYGVDSLLAVELSNWIAKEFAADVPVFDIMSGASFNSIGMAIAVGSQLRKKV